MKSPEQERILERLSLSPYKKNFILKGGLLISSMIGVSERTTKDMDTTVRGIDMDEGNPVPKGPFFSAKINDPAFERAKFRTDKYAVH